MAETAILAAIKVLGGPLVNEALKHATSRASGFSRLDSRVRDIKNELHLMQAFLNEINTRGHNSETFDAWLVQVQNLAYNIQDTIDEFIYLVDHGKSGRKLSCLKLFFNKPKSLRNLRRIASQLHETEKKLKNLAAMKDQWVSTLINTGASINPAYNYNESSQRAAVSAHFIDEDKLVGIEKNRATLTSWIYSNGLNLSIISVWGMGGLGKTTLVTNIFKREKNNFDCHAWVSISQTYMIDQLLRNLICEICESEQIVSINTTNMDLRKLKETLTKLLKQKKYLIILDDAWDPIAVESISDTLVDNCKGSRIVITTRNEDVASLARKEHRLHLKPLADSESWELFCRKAFQYETEHECPSNLEEWAREIVLKCDGLPLALVSIGGMLFLRERSVVEWKRVNDQLSWELEHNPSFDRIRNILYLSFNCLPKNIKSCFLHCSMFPEDHLIERKKLIRLWIAEGFIEERGESTLEEVAEGYLIELIRRSMLQLVKKNDFGRVKRCRMHDTVRELAISLSMKENTCLLNEDDKNVKIYTSTRHLSVIKMSKEIRHSADVPQLRTFLSFDSRLLSSFLSSILLKSRYLTVLDLEGLPMETLPDTIGDLFNLHYLGLRSTEIKFLPKTIEKLRNLQTIDLFNSNIQKLPNGIGKLTKLRHLFAQRAETPSPLRNISGISLPKGLADLKELQTLQALEANAELVKELGNLTQLRSFRILNVKESYSADLCTALSKMPLLSFLHINASSEIEFLQLEHLNPSPPQLQKLTLIGRFKENTFASPLFQISGKNFQTLYLKWSRLQNDPLPSLSHLSNLTILYLNRAYDGQLLTFRAGWFPKLKALGLVQLPSLIQVEMEKGTMVSVERISLGYIKQLLEIPKGIEHLTSLQLLHCEGLSDNFGGLMKGHNRIWHFNCYVKS
ncbi:hypothetical protein LUZ60_005018 [Juncus effusus]|nr:hypothetical protein LUZ60_005018 [Juncus effusus]